MFVVWFRMYPGDAEERWPHEILVDGRVIQTWDEPKAAGRWFMTHLADLKPSRGGDGRFPQQVDALWDSYLLFGPEAEWDTLPAPLLSSGSTVIGERDRLAASIGPLLNPRGG